MASQLATRWERYKILMYGSKRISLYHHYRLPLELHQFGHSCFHWHHFRHPTAPTRSASPPGNSSPSDRCSIDLSAMDSLRRRRRSSYPFSYKKTLSHRSTNILLASVIAGKFLFGYCCPLGLGKYFLSSRRSHERVDSLTSASASRTVPAATGQYCKKLRRDENWFKTVLSAFT